MPIIKECPLSFKAVEEFAGYIREYIEKEQPGLCGEKITNWLLKRLGGKSYIPSMWDGKSYGTFIIRSENDFELYLSPYSTQLQDIWKLAHAIGHYFLHCDFKKKGEARFIRLGPNREEWQANRFAAGLLMPKDEFIEQWEKYDGNLWMISAYFMVGYNSANIRAEMLK